MSDSKNIVLYHHPYSRAAGVVFMLEEIGRPYELRFVDFAGGEQSTDAFRRTVNPMGKIPVLVDGDVKVTEVAAIGIYLADKYALGDLAPALDDPQRGAYLRWSFFAPSVIEPGVMAKHMGWSYKPSAAGWGEHDAMLDAMEQAIGEGPWLLGDRFSMADVIFGGLVRYLLRFQMLEPRPSFMAYVERLSDRPASKAADAKNQAIIAERGLA